MEESKSNIGMIIADKIEDAILAIKTNGNHSPRELMIILIPGYAFNFYQSYINAKLGNPNIPSHDDFLNGRVRHKGFRLLPGYESNFVIAFHPAWPEMGINEIRIQIEY